MKIKVIRAYSGEEGVGVDKDVHEGTEHTVTRARGNQLKANGLVEVLEDEADEDQLKTDGPTIAEYIAAGYLATNYPPSGYASRSTSDEIAEAIAKQAGSAQTTDVSGTDAAPVPGDGLPSGAITSTTPVNAAELAPASGTQESAMSINTTTAGAVSAPAAKAVIQPENKKAREAANKGAAAPANKSA